MVGVPKELLDVASEELAEVLLGDDGFAKALAQVLEGGGAAAGEQHEQDVGTDTEDERTAAEAADADELPPPLPPPAVAPSHLDLRELRNFAAAANIDDGVVTCPLGPLSSVPIVGMITSWTRGKYTSVAVKCNLHGTKCGVKSQEARGFQRHGVAHVALLRAS